MRKRRRNVVHEKKNNFEDSTSEVESFFVVIKFTQTLEG
jgi:hypothetical protein